MGKPEGRRMPGKPTRRWEDYIKINLPVLGRGNGLDRANRQIAVNVVMNFRVS